MTGRANTTVLRGGRVIDPGTGLDRVTDLAFSGRHVTAIGDGLSGDTVVDVSGLIVGPGFIDLHSHTHTIAGQRLQAFDGVTTALDLETGLMPIGAAHRLAADAGRPLNYGFSASWAAARGQVLAGFPAVPDFFACLGLLGVPDWNRASTPAELAATVELLRGELEAGALGIGIPIGYAPEARPHEYLAAARLAAEAGAPTFTHVRELVESDPRVAIDGSTEVCAAAAETGAHMHHCHVNSTSRRHVDRVLDLIARTVAEGSRVTVEAYPYGAGSTGIGAAFLAPERLARWGMAPSDLVLLPSGERIADEARLRQVRAETPDMMCITHSLDESDPADMAYLERALAFPDAIVASDAVPIQFTDGTRESREWPLPPGTTHPRTAGTFAKAIRVMTLENATWDWLETFRRCSWLPARTLDAIAPSMLAKGHLGIGADADIVVIDPTALTDRATYLDATVTSAGVSSLFVNGVPVISSGELILDAMPGEGVRGEP